MSLIRIQFSFLIFLCSFNLASQIKNNNEILIREYFASLRKHQRNPDSLNFYENKIIDLLSNEDNPRIKGNSYLSLGQLYYRLQKYEKSMQYYYKTKSIAKQKEYEDLETQASSNIASVHLQTSYQDSAFYYYNKVKAYYLKEKDSVKLHYTIDKIADVYFRNQKLDSAELYFKKSISFYKKIDEKLAQNFPVKKILSGNYTKLANINFLKNDYKEAIIYADSSLQVAKNNNIIQLFKPNYNLIARSYKGLGNDSKANEYYDLEANAPSPKINPQQVLLSATRNRKVVADKFNDDIERDKNQLEKRKFYKSSLFISLFVVLILVMLAFYFFKKKQLLKKEFAIIQKEIDILKTQKETSIDPSTFITLKSKALININEILYIKSDGHYVEYYLDSKIRPEVDRNTLKEVIENLPSNKFVQIHRSYVVNIYRIKIINSTKLMLDDGTWINLTRTYKKDLKSILQKEVNY